jgi:glycosyltransferase involved in cell wall biosynthesis
MAKFLLSALAARRGGGLTYVRNLVESFPQDGDDQLWILSHKRIEGLPDRSNVEWIRAPRWTTHPIMRFLIGWVYFRFFWPRRDDFDAVCFAGGSFDAALPKHVATVVVFHNMLPFDRAARRRYRVGWMRLRHLLLWFVQGWAMYRADLVIFISEHGRRVIDRAFKSRRGGSVVIPHTLTRTIAPLDLKTARRLPESFVLYLSSIDAYKAQVELVEAWALLRKSRAVKEKLVLAGPEYAPYARRVRETIRRCGVEGEVILLGAVRPDEVFDLAERALLNLFLSSCENCPYTLIELMSAGRPMLVSSREPMRELGGPDLEYVDSYNVPVVAKALERMLDDADLRRRVGMAAEQRSRRFLSGKGGTATWQAIHAATGRRSAAETSRHPATPGVIARHSS